MATQTLEFSAASGLTINCKLFALESDTVVDTQTATEKTNDLNRYSVDFTDTPAGVYRLNGFVGSAGGFVNEIYDLTLATDVFIPRSEVGLGNLPSATDISDRLERDGGPLDVAIDAIAPLTGPFAFTPTVVDSVSDAAIEAANVRVYRTGKTESKRTSANGTTSPFGLDQNFWTIVTTAHGYASDVRTLNISDDTELEIALVAHEIGVPDSAAECRLVVYVDINAEPIQGATVTARLKSDNQATDGRIKSNQIVSVSTNADGLATLDLIRGTEFVDGDGVYVIQCKHNKEVIWSIEAAMPDQATVNLEDLLTP